MSVSSFLLELSSDIIFRLTAIFLAAKTSNHPIGIDPYVNNIPKTKASDVLDLEFLVAQSLRFEFTVWHVHRALWGIWLDAQVRGLKPGLPALY